MNYITMKKSHNKESCWVFQVQPLEIVSTFVGHLNFLDKIFFGLTARIFMLSISTPTENAIEK